MYTAWKGNSSFFLLQPYHPHECQTQSGCLWSSTVIPQPFGTRAWFCGRHFSHRLGLGGWFPDDSSAVGFLLLWESSAAVDLTGSGAQAVMWAMGNSHKYMWSFACSPTAHLLCIPVPNRHWYQSMAWELGTPGLADRRKDEKTLSWVATVFRGTFILPLPPLTACAKMREGHGKVTLHHEIFNTCLFCSPQFSTLHGNQRLKNPK